MMNLNEDDLAKELARELDPPKPRLVLKPSEVGSVVDNATNPDTDRATKGMREQMEKIVSGIEQEIKEAEEVKSTIQRRIEDLNITLSASKASLEILNRNPIKK